MRLRWVLAGLLLCATPVVAQQANQYWRSGSGVNPFAPVSTANPLPVSIIAGSGGAATIADGADVAQGTTTDTACTTDNGTCTEIALLKRANQQLTTLINGVSGIALAPVVCGSAVSSCVLKGSPGTLFSVYVECSAACWLQVFNAVSAPSNGATTAGIASGNMVECIPIQAGGVGGLSSSGMPPTTYTVGITATISSTTCATLTLATTGFVRGMIQ